MCDVLDLDSNNGHLASAQLDGESVSCVLIFCQPVFATVSENPLNLESCTADALGPNYFRLGETLTLCKYFLLDKKKTKYAYLQENLDAKATR